MMITENITVRFNWEDFVCACKGVFLNTTPIFLNNNTLRGVFSHKHPQTKQIPPFRKHLNYI